MNEILVARALNYREYLLLRLLEDVAHIVLCGVCRLGYLVAGGDELAKPALVADDSCIVLYVSRGGDYLSEYADVCTSLLVRGVDPATDEHIYQGNYVYGLVLQVQLLQCEPYLAVILGGEILRCQLVRDEIQTVRVDKHRADDRLLRLYRDGQLSSDVT